MKHSVASKYFLSLLCLSFLFSSCKKELEEIEVDPVIAWEVHNKFLYDMRYIANLYSKNDNLQVLGMRLFSTISLEGEQENVNNYVHPFRNVSNHKHPMNSRIFGGAEGNSLYFRSVKNPVTSRTGLTLDVTKLDPHFIDFRLVLSSSSESFVISENNVALVPYTYYNEENGRHGLRYLLVKLAFDTYSFNSETIVLEEAHILTPTEEGGYVRHMQSHRNNFYVATDWGFYKITENGEISFQLPDQAAYATFEHKGDIYTMARHGRQQHHNLFRAMSEQTWSIDASIGSLAESFSYTAVSDDILLAYRHSQIFEVELGIDKLLFRELDNTGLVGHSISSIAKVNDKVYIGTQSGLFTKSVEHLLTYKEKED